MLSKQVIATFLYCVPAWGGYLMPGEPGLPKGDVDAATCLL